MDELYQRIWSRPSRDLLGAQCMIWNNLEDFTTGTLVNAATPGVDLDRQHDRTASTGCQKVALTLFYCTLHAVFSAASRAVAIIVN